MTLDGVAGNSGFPALEGAGLLRFIPEPKSRSGTVFRTLVNGAQNLFGTGQGLFGGGQGLLGGLGADVSGLPGQLTELLNEQIEVQFQMQTVSLVSNVIKSEHETEMAAIRNMRVG